MKLNFFSLVVFISVIQSCLGQSPIVPSPILYLANEGSFHFKELIIADQNMDKNELELFQAQLNSIYPISISNELESGTPTIFFYDLSEGNNLDKDSYLLNVQSSKIVINYTGKAGKMYAWLSLIQLIEEESNHLFSIKVCDIVDYPAFNWRGLHLDVARHFFTVDEVKRFIDLMAFYKFNTFHWHLTDDQGWRIEIKKYPKLTTIGSFRDSTIVGHYNADPRTYEVMKVGGFYTQEQIKEVVAYANQRHIEIIPEIEMPGHARAALAAYPNLSCTEKWQPVPGLWGVFDDIFCSKPETIQFLKDVLSEVVELFPSEYIHIGGDEAPKMRWHECKHCQKNIKANHLKDEHELQSYFIQQMDDYLTSKGKKLIGWDEILEGGLSKNAAVMSWRGEEGGIEAANQNHAVVMSPTTYCYFDYYQSGDQSEPLAIGGYLPLEKVYEYSPIPPNLANDKQKYILGGQANLWTEYISDFKHVEYMVYPRALAIAEKLWCIQPPKYDEFLHVFRTFQEPLLQKMNVNYAHSIYATKIKPSRTSNGIALTVRGIDSLSKSKVTITGFNEISAANGSIIDWNDSIRFDRTNAGMQKEITVLVKGFNDDGPTTEQQFILHNGLGLNIELITQPHAKYSYNGSLTLVDGIKGSRPWKGDQWLGFNETTVEFIIDLNVEKSLANLTVGFLDAKGSWIYLPKDLEIWRETSKGEWIKMKSAAINQENQLVELNFKANKLKIIAHSIPLIPNGAEGAGNVPWTFIDEVILNYK